MTIGYDNSQLLPPSHVVEDAVRRALEEDLGYGDLTTESTVPAGVEVDGDIIVRANGVVAGLPVVQAVFAALDPEVRFEPVVADGMPVRPDDRIAAIAGPARAILSGERVALNFLQQLSGVATATRRIVELLEGTSTVLLDTRKTVPGLRALQRYAVRAGGGSNHRFNLFDGVLIKENHILAGGGIAAALERARAAVGPFTPVEIEIERLDQLEEAIQHGADMVLLDNMTLEEMSAAVALSDGRVKLEASGDITAERARLIAETGVHFLSSGAITHSSTALNLSLRLDGPA